MKDSNYPRRRLRPDDAAAYVGLSGSTLAKLRCFGGGPTFAKLGRSIVYDADDLDAWVAARKRASTSDMGNA